MTDTMFATTTTDDLAEMLFRTYLDCSWIGPDGRRRTIPCWDEADHAEELLHDAGEPAASLGVVLDGYRLLVRGQRAIDEAAAHPCRACHGDGEIHHHRLDAQRGPWTCIRCGGNGVEPLALRRGAVGPAPF